MVNGQAEVRAAAGAPVSLAVQPGVTTQYEMQVATKPPGAPVEGPTAPVDAGAGRLGSTTVGAAPGGLLDPAIAFAGRPKLKIVPAPGPAPLTMRLLNSRLNEPRGLLFFFAGDGEPDDLIFRSHGFNQYCDCRNGPLPVATGITKAFGAGETFFVNFQVQCHVDLLERLPTDPPPIVLSNRFSTTHEIDADSYLQIHVDGEAHFRTDRLYDLQFNADALRQSLFLPVPAGFMRGGIEVHGSEDGASVRYSYIDRQMPVNFVAGRYVNATQISAVHRQALGNGKDLFSTALDAYQSVTNARIMQQQLRQLGTNRRAPRIPKRKPKR
jgi:hypothetical protein